MLFVWGWEIVEYVTDLITINVSGKELADWYVTLSNHDWIAIIGCHGCKSLAKIDESIPWESIGCIKCTLKSIVHFIFCKLCATNYYQ